jgi:uncharacterized protein
MSGREAAPDAATLRVKVVPRASRNEVVGWRDGVLRVRVMAPPQDGRANSAVLALLAEVLGVRAGALTVAAGHASAHKRVAIHGLARAEVERRIAAATGHENDAAI